MPQVVPIVMGSPRDHEKFAPAIKVLESFGLTAEVHVMSAHRNHAEVAEFARLAKQRGYRAIISGAGMSNALSGAIGAQSRLPILAVPLSGGILDGLDALLSSVQMPPGMPIATFPVDGSANAALDVVRRFALDDPGLDRKLRGFIERGSNVKAPMPDHTGKVRDTFILPSEGGPVRLIYTSDRMSAFDYVLDDPIPGKGRVLNRLTRFWLDNPRLASIVPNHLVSDEASYLPDWARLLPRDQLMVVQDLEMIPLECIVRGYLVGSAWKEYQKSGTMHGTKLPEGMVLGQKLPRPTFTPSTKAPEGEHDENISVEQAREIIGEDRVRELERISIKLFATAQAIAAERGILILDTKFEFGIDPASGEIVLADEVFTPDSSRFVDASTFVEGEEPLSMDKEYLRQRILGTGWSKDDDVPPPPLPLDAVYETARRYDEIDARLTA